MDLFRPLYWADNGGVYTVWKSFYPPLNYIILKLVKLIFVGSATFADAFALRAAAFPVVLFFIFSYLITPVIVLKTKLWDCFAGKEKVLLYFIIILSTPMLFELERGNLIIYTLIFIAIILNKEGVFRVIGLAVLINLKPYFALLLFYYVIRRNWKQLWLCTIASGMMFLITGILLNQHFLLIFSNMFSFSQMGAAISLKEVMAMPSCITAYSYVLNNEAIQHTKYGQIFNLHAIATTISAIKWFVLAWVLVALYNRQYRLSDTQIFAILLVVITNSGTWVGGWSLIFYTTLLPVFITMRFRNAYCIILLLMFVPLDFIPVVRATLGEQYSYLTDSMVVVHWTTGLGSVLKPILNFVLLVTLLYEIRQLTPQIQEELAPNHP